MQVYIIPCAPREVNIPARVRDHLLNSPCGPAPPHPSQLDEACRIIYELMNDSLLVPFLESVAAQAEHHAHESAPRRLSNNGRPGFSFRSATSMHPIETECLTDDSDCNSSPATEPMTPPTTPPTSEWTFTTSPGGLQRAVAAHNKGWKKMGAKLGFNRKSSRSRSAPTSSVPGSEDLHMQNSL